MQSNILSDVGMAAGIGGIALCVLLMVFRDIIRKQIFPMLPKRDAYRLLRLMVVLTFFIAMCGIAAWTYSKSLGRPPVRELASTIIDNCYRRAFALNYTQRFVNIDDYNRVERSMRECYRYVQSQMVEIQQTAPAPVRAAAMTLLGQLDSLDVLFTKTRPYATNRYYGDTAGVMPGRLDGSGQRELTGLFRAMERIRREFLASLQQLATLTNTDLPRIPASLRDTIPFTPHIDLEPL